MYKDFIKYTRKSCNIIMFRYPEMVVDNER